MQTLLIILLGALVVATFPLLYLSLFLVNIPRMQQHFSVNERTLFAGRFPLILKAFLTGNNRATGFKYNISQLRYSLNEEFDDFYRGFGYEGTGMGFGARASLLPAPGKRFESLIHKLDSNYIYQYYVGLGWFLQFRFGYRFNGYRRWLSQLNPRYASIVFDGVGFKTALFSYLQNRAIIRKFDHFPQHHQRVCYQGMGRGVWFLSRFNLDQAQEEIQLLPSSFRNDAYSGLGLAVAYSMFDHLATAFRSESEVPACYLTSFRQGLSFGWEARRLQNKSYWDEQLANYSSSGMIRVKHYISIVHQARDILESTDAPTSDQYYVKWMDETRKLLAGII